MILRKTKFSYVTNVIYALLASAVSIIAILDAAQGLGYTYMPGLIAFAVIILLGLVFKKLLSYTEMSDKFKAISEKENVIGIAVFAVLLIASIAFRVFSYMWNGLGGTAYFELAKVTGEQMAHIVHPCDDWYLSALHGIFFLFGNRIFVAAIFNITIQIIAVIFGFAAFRKMLGMIPALLFAGFWTISGFSVHEALTLSSRNLVFLLICITLFAISFAVPATRGKFISYLVSGILTAVCIYADISGLALIPFLVGILFNAPDEEEEFSLRVRKMLFALISVIFGLVLLIFLDSYLSSSNPANVLNSIARLYKSSGNFTLGFSYMTSYAEVTVLAVLGTLSIMACFISYDDSRSILTLSALVIILINNFGLTYLENDGREVFFMVCTLLAGVSFRELFPDKITGDVFKASAELYDNEVVAPAAGYVPKKLDSGSFTSDDLDALESGSFDPVPKKTEDPSGDKAADDGLTGPDLNLGFDAVNIGTPGPAVNVAPPVVNAADYMTPNARNIQPLSASSQVGLNKAEEEATENPKPQNVGGALGVQKEEPQDVHTRNVGAALKESDSAQDSAGKSSEEKKKTAYVPYKKPQLRPEYRRRPGAWAQQYAEKTKLAEKEKAIQEAKAEEAKKAQETKKEEVKEQAHTPEVAANGAVLLDNPIPHPTRKTEHHPMEYDIDLSSDKADYDIKISDDDDFDI
ncbi:MAG: hypothetical protein KBG42_06565 [Lachnospiraceae bacterium]|nr:hypothetical protein [Lachnospiraceae bacterium]